MRFKLNLRRIGAMFLLVAGILAASGSLVTLSDSGSRAQQPVDPDEIFAVLAHQTTEADRFPDEPVEYRAIVEGMDTERVRLLGETIHARYYVSVDERGWVCLMSFPHSTSGDDGVLSQGCGPPGDVAENGLATGGRLVPGPFHMAYALPQGYEFVVDETGEVVGEVDGQLFTITYQGPDDEPRELIAKGPAGELNLSIGFTQHDVDAP